MSRRYANSPDPMSGDEWKSQLQDWKQLSRTIKFEDEEDFSDDDMDFRVTREPSPPSTSSPYGRESVASISSQRRVRPASASRSTAKSSRKSSTMTSTSTSKKKKRPTSATGVRNTTTGARKRPASATPKSRRPTPYEGGSARVTRGSGGTTLAGLTAVRGRDPFLPTDPESLERAGMDSNLTLEDVYLDELGLAAAALKERTRRKGPGTSLDKEELYERNQELKKKLRAFEDEKVTLKAKLSRAEKEVVKKDRMLESLVQGQDFVGNRFDNYRSESNTINSLRKRVKSLEQDLHDRETNITKLKSDRKATRVAELELELKTYYNETRRLQKLLGPLMAQQQSGIKPSRKSSRRAFAGAGATDGELIALQEEALHIKTKNKNLKAENAALERKVMRYTKENEQLCQRLLSIDTQLQGMPQSERMTVQDAQAEIQKLKRELKSQAQMIELMESDSHQKRKEMEEERGPMEAKLGRKREKMETLKQENAKLERLYTVEQGNSARLRSELAAAEQEIDNIKAENGQAVERLRRLEANAAATEDELHGASKSHREEVRALEKQLKAEQKRNSRVNADLDRAKDEIASLRTQLEEARAEATATAGKRSSYEIKEDDTDIYAKEAQAATTIQARYRGHMVRRKARPSKRQQDISKTKKDNSDDGDDDLSISDDDNDNTEAAAPANQEEHEAATKIQARYRGLRGRRRTEETRQAKAATRLQALERGRQARKEYKKKVELKREIQKNEADTYSFGQAGEAAEPMYTLSEEEDMEDAATKIQALHRGRKIRRQNTLETLRAEREGSSNASRQTGKEEERAATRIQAVYRGRAGRKRYSEMRRKSRGTRAPHSADDNDVSSARAQSTQEEHYAATRIQARYRGYHARRTRHAGRGATDTAVSSSPVSRKDKIRAKAASRRSRLASRNDDASDDGDFTVHKTGDNESSDIDDIEGEPYDAGDAEEESADSF